MPKLINNQSEQPLISILIPARNEEQNLPNLLQDLLNQNYKNIEIIVYNDLSDDNTPNIVLEFSKEYKEIKLINGKELPEGWYGKSYACWNLGNVANGEFLLFLDADVRVKNNLIHRAIYFMRHNKVKFLSIFPKQIMLSFSEKLIVPLMNIILLSLLPLKFVQFRYFPSLSAANGQFMMYQRDIFFELNPYEKFKANRAEDIAIAYYFKKKKQKIACLLGDDELQCRMYSSFSDAINGFSKNVISFFRNSVFFALFYFLANFFTLPLIFILFKFKLFLLILIVQLISLILILVQSEQQVLLNILLQPIRLSILFYLIIKSVMNRKSKGFLWKGRFIK